MYNGDHIEFICRLAEAAVEGRFMIGDYAIGFCPAYRQLLTILIVGNTGPDSPEESQLFSTFSPGTRAYPQYLIKFNSLASGAGGEDERPRGVLQTVQSNRGLQGAGRPSRWSLFFSHLPRAR